MLRAALKPADYRNDEDLEHCFNNLVKAIENAPATAQLEPLRHLMLTFLREPSEKLDKEKWNSREFRARLSHVQHKTCDVIAQRMDIVPDYDRRQLLEEFLSNFAVFLQRAPVADKDAQRAGLKMSMRAIKHLTGWDRVATAGALYRKVFEMDAEPHRFKQNKNYNLALSFARREMKHLNDQYQNLRKEPQTIAQCQALLESIELLDNASRDIGVSPAAARIQDQGRNADDGKAWQKTSPHLQKALANARSLLIVNVQRAAEQAEELARMHALSAHFYAESAGIAYSQLQLRAEWEPALSNIKRASDSAYERAALAFQQKELALSVPEVSSKASRDAGPLRRRSAALQDAVASFEVARVANETALASFDRGLAHVRARFENRGAAILPPQLPPGAIPFAAPGIPDAAAPDERAIVAARNIADTFARAGGHDLL